MTTFADQPLDLVRIIADYGNWADVAALTATHDLDTYIARRFPHIVDRANLDYLAVLFEGAAYSWQNTVCQRCFLPDQTGYFETHEYCQRCTVYTACIFCGKRSDTTMAIPRYQVRVVEHTALGYHTVAPRDLARYLELHPYTACMKAHYDSFTERVCKFEKVLNELNDDGTITIALRLPANKNIEFSGACFNIAKCSLCGKEQYDNQDTENFEYVTRTSDYNKPLQLECNMCTRDERKCYESDNDDEKKYGTYTIQYRLLVDDLLVLKNFVYYNRVPETFTHTIKEIIEHDGEVDLWPDDNIGDQSEWYFNIAIPALSTLSGETHLERLTDIVGMYVSQVSQVSPSHDGMVQRATSEVLEILNVMKTASGLGAQ